MKKKDSMRELAIVFAADTNFSIPFGVAVLSLLEHARPETYYDIYVLDDGIREEVKVEVEKFKEKYYFNITYYNVSDMVKDMPGTCIFPPITYARFLVPKLLPKEAQNRIFYIDADVLFCDDLTELYDMDLEGKPFAATQALNMTAYGNRGYLKWLGKEYGLDFYEKGKPYFHAGEMLFDRAEWEKAGLTEACLKMAQEPFPEGILYYDQDFMNVACRGKIANFPLRYCIIPQFEHRYLCDYDSMYEGLSLYSEEELISAYDKPAIIHYAGLKPIVFHDLENKHDQAFVRALLRSPWKNRVPYFPRNMLMMKANPTRNAFLQDAEATLPVHSVSIVVSTRCLLKSSSADKFISLIDSLHAQTLENLEIIVVDRQSDDGSIDILRKYSEMGILKYVESQAQSQWEAYNEGLNMARGSYILFLNATDKLNAANCLESMLQVAENDEADVVCGNCHIVDAESQIIKSHRASIPATEYVLPMHLSASMFRVRMLQNTKGFSAVSGSTGVDYLLFAHLLRHNAKVVACSSYVSICHDNIEETHERQQLWLNEMAAIQRNSASCNAGAFVPASDDAEAKVGIIVPLLKQCNHFSALLQSLRQQTLSELQILIVGPDTHESMQYAKSVATEDSRVICISCPSDSSYGTAYNLGLNRARSTYVSFILPNDLLAPNFYQLLFEVAQNNNATVVKASTHCLNSYGLAIPTDVTSSVSSILKSGGSLLSSFNKESYSAIFLREYAYRRKACHSDRSPYCDDAYFMMQILLHLPISAVKIANDAVYYHRVQPDVFSDITSVSQLLTACETQVAERFAYLLSQKETNSPSVIFALSSTLEQQLGGVINNAIDNHIDESAIHKHLSALSVFQKQWKSSSVVYHPGTLASAFESMGFSCELFLVHKSAYQTIAHQRGIINVLQNYKNEQTAKTLELSNQVEKLKRLLQLHIQVKSLRKKLTRLRLKRFFSFGKRRMKYKEKIITVKAILREYRQAIAK